MWKRFTGLATVVTALLLVTAACSSAATPEVVVVDDSATEEVSQQEPPSESDRILEVELNEFNILADSFAFAPGETVEFVVTNSGVVEHELRLSNTDRVEEHLEGGHDDADHDDEAMSEDEMAAMPDDDQEATDADHDDDEADHEGEAADAVLVLAPGESGTLLFTFPDNDHDYTSAVCLIPGHYEAGMATDLAY